MKKFKNFTIFVVIRNLLDLTAILSQRGAQQGDPLRPPLFCYGIQSMINYYLPSELNI
jgi:hypothetical protein